MSRKPTKDETTQEEMRTAAEEDAAKAAEAEAERQAAEAGGQQAMEMPAPGNRPLTRAEAEALEMFAADFERAPPAGADPGPYITNVNDRWWGNRYGIADGIHTVGRWEFTFNGGGFISVKAVKESTDAA